MRQLRGPGFRVFLELARVTQINYSAAGTFAAAPTKYFIYDSASLSGTAMANAVGRLAEAYTGSSKYTDEYFSYDKDGNLTDTWESTPGSGIYDHVSASYWPNGLPDQLSVPGVPTITYTPDGEGRVSSVSANGTNLLSSASYAIGSANLVTTLTYGSGDSDTATVNLASGEPTQYQFAINGSTDTGNLSWNSNGTLSSLDITDNLNSSDTQNCTFAYDDLGRLGSNTGNGGVSCGTNWGQDFSFDAFGNISTSGNLSFQPTSYSNNQISGWSLNGQSVAYNGDGDLISDPFHTFAWDASNELEAMDSSITLVRDALGRVVEIDDGTIKQEVLYAPFGGKIALMSGANLNTAWIPLANGAEAVYNGSGFEYFRHPDWLGSSRLASTWSRGVYSDTTYSPYGVAYDSSGTSDLDFTGHNSLITNPSSSEVLSDFMFREYSSLQGRWIQPDPAGLAAVNPADPQSWNRYAYVNNQPLNSIDLFGLDSGTQCASQVNMLYPNPYDPQGPAIYGPTIAQSPYQNCGQVLDNETANEIILNFIYNNPSNITNGPSNVYAGPGGINGGGGSVINYLNSLLENLMSPYNGPLPNCMTESGKNILHAGMTGASDFVRGAGEFISNIMQAFSFYTFGKTLQYASIMGLAYPLQSSVFRSGMQSALDLSEYGDLVSPIAMIISIDVATVKGGLQTITEALNGQCH
jgi:RHS repeat-associated protein